MKTLLDRRKPVSKLSLSDKGAQFIAAFEGFRASPYNDAAGYATVGYGHLIHYSNVTAEDRKRWPGGISRVAALHLLKADAETAAQCVRSYVKVPLTQHAFDALVSFVFNIGCGGFADSTVLRKLNAGRYKDVPKALLMWDRAGGTDLEGLRRRRQAEGDLFMHGKYA